MAADPLNSEPDPRHEVARLTRELERRDRDLAEAIEQQTVTAEVLGVIASAPTDLQRVLDTIAKSAARLCEASDAVVQRVEGDVRRVVAFCGSAMVGSLGIVSPNTRGSVAGRAIIDRVPVHVHDLAALVDTEFPDALEVQRRWGYRTVLATPLLRGGEVLGCIFILRLEVRPFTDKQIELVKTFADQAVIAIENARLFQALEDRNSALSEALEQQTATGEILRVIASSPADLQHVLDSLVTTGARLCEAPSACLLQYDGNALRVVAACGVLGDWMKSDEASEVAQRGIAANPESISGRAMFERRTVHVPDIAAAGSEFPDTARDQVRIGHRAQVSTPLLRKGEPIGVLAVQRFEPGPFAEAQIKLLETFADQAVIAIENTRLFRELQERNRDLSEALERQTATADILRVIASSPTDVQPVLEAVAESAARLFDAWLVNVFRIEDGVLRIVAAGPDAPRARRMAVPVDPGHVTGRAIIERRTIHIPDIRALPEGEYPISREFSHQFNWRTVVTAPFLAKGVPVGAISLNRREVRPFTDREIELVQSFADQAAIAIENARLFRELQDRVEELRALGEVGRAVGSTLDLQEVLGTVVAHAHQLSGTDGGVLYEYDEAAGEFRLRATRRVDAEMIEALKAAPIRLGEGAIGRAALAREPVQIPDITAGGAYEGRLREAMLAAGHRAVLAVPLLREDRILGGLVVIRKTPGEFPPNVVELVQTFASQSALAIQNARLFGELRSRVDELQALGEIIRTVSSSLDLDQMLANIAARAVELCQADSGSIHELDEATGRFELRASHTGDPEHLRAVGEYVYRRDGRSVMERAVAERRPIQIPDVCDAPDYPLREAMLRAGIRAVLGMPILHDERVIGTLLVRRQTAGLFAPETVALLQTFANQSSVAIQNAQLFRELEQKSRELAAASRHKSEFLANMSHELRTPLNAIIGFSEVLLERLFGDLNEKQEEYLRDILTSGQHLLSLINDILDLSKVEAGRMELEVSTFSLREVLENGLTMLKERAGRHGIHLTLEVDPGLDVVEADERKVKQVVFNLLSNAVKFTPDGGSVTLAARRGDGAVEMTVTDSGIGIAPEDLPHVFDEFRQVGRGQAKQEGTGLGLALTKKLVELHRGAIRAQSEVGVGSAFTVMLPQPRVGPETGPS